ncbi:MAG: PP2C family protein-serine/threonine phosphatase, partial [bacterium]|nr:PP2C family protein-serine/threonine phosphatase [bacterium]
REQIEIDPQYNEIKEETLKFFRTLQVELLIPLTMQEQLVGILGLGKKENLQSFRIRDVELLEHIGKQIGITIDNALHHGDIVEKERIAEELRLGRQIQTSLLPQTPPKISKLSLQGLMQPAKEIGGDYYDFISLPGQDRMGIVIGDVSGKGVAAGLLMAMVKTAIHIFSSRETSPKQILIRINEILDKHIGGEKFMTMLYLIWQAAKSTLTYSSAGHEHILVYRKSTGEVEEILSGGTILGIVPDIDKILEEKNIILRTGDKILLYTDGATEARNQQKEHFGLEGLKKAFMNHSKKSAEAIMKSVKDEIYEFIGNYPQYDDITLVVLEAE